MQLAPAVVTLQQSRHGNPKTQVKNQTWALPVSTSISISKRVYSPTSPLSTNSNPVSGPPIPAPAPLPKKLSSRPKRRLVLSARSGGTSPRSRGTPHVGPATGSDPCRRGYRGAGESTRIGNARPTFLVGEIGSLYSQSPSLRL